MEDADDYTVRGDGEITPSAEAIFTLVQTLYHIQFQYLSNGGFRDAT